MEETSIKFIHGKPLRGWLRKQGGKMRGWQRRFFVLYDSCLFYFNREDDTQVSNSYCLHEYHLKDVPASPDEPDKFAFELVADRGNSDSILLSAASDTEKKEWTKALCYNMYAEKGGAIFGLPLELAMEYEHKRGRQVPYIVEACTKHLEKFALETEGIFRLAGRAGLLRELRAQFEMARWPSLDDIDVHTVGSLLKAYLRELPESLVPPDMYQRIMNCAMRHAETSAEESRKAEVVCLSTLLEELPDIHYTTLAYICRFLHRLAANSDKTKMTVHNLALVFGPNLIRHLDSSPELLMLTADLTQHLAYMMINHCPEVLPSRPQREAVPAGAMDSPYLRKKQQGGGVNSVATADLLRMSVPLDARDPKLLAPRPSALRRELMNLELFSSHSDSSDRNQSPNTPPSPFLFINDYFDDTDKKVSERLQEMRLGEAGDTSDMAVVMRPVAPRRFKSRSMRTRRSGGTPSSPKSPDSPRHLDSQDILTALASVSQDVDSAASGQEKSEEEKAFSKFLSSAKYGPALKDSAGGEDGKKLDVPGHLSKPGNRHMSIGRSHSSYAKVCNGKFSIESKGKASEADSAVSSEGSRLRPSEAVLEAQITALKSELANVKARSERMVTALKNQLTDIHSKYEARISSLESQQRREMVDLTAKLDAERTARAEAVEKTASLRSQLYRYRLQYGDLPDAQAAK